jgi:hypothetical protein
VTYLFDVTDLRDLAPDVIDPDGLPRVMPAAYYAETTAEERAWLGLRYGLYALPTEELCDWLIGYIAGRSAIEIGSGNGRMAQRVGIPATDSYLQDDPAIRKYFAVMKQVPVTYGPNVERLEALDAVRRYRPAVVIGCWITHRYNPRRHGLGGNEFGPKMPLILDRCEEYIHIGNTKTHALDPLWDRPHELHHFPWLYSRSVTGTPDFLAVWRDGL